MQRELSWRSVFIIINCELTGLLFHPPSLLPPPSSLPHSLQGTLQSEEVWSGILSHTHCHASLDPSTQQHSSPRRTMTQSVDMSPNPHSSHPHRPHSHRSHPHTSTRTIAQTQSMPSNFEAQRDDPLSDARLQLGNQSGELPHHNRPRPLRNQSAKGEGEEWKEGREEGRVVAMASLARENDDVIAVPVRTR